MTMLNATPPGAFRCDTSHVHTAGCCGRRNFLKGMAAMGAGALFGAGTAKAQTAASEKPFRIDVHHHFSSPGFIAEITGRKTGQVPLMRLTAQKSIEDMDKGGVATSILSISEPSVFFGNYDAARALARETNDFGARLVREYPGRFGLFGTVPLPDVEGSLREIEYALDTLKADGICMMTDYEGKFLGDPAFTPVMEELNRRKAVVYTHPFRNACCRNLVPDVFEPAIELGTDTTRTIASLIFSGTAPRFPDIKFIFSHAGGTAPYLVQRFTFLADLRKDLRSRLPEGPIHYLQRFYYDTANASTVYPLASLMKLIKPTQLVFGTDFPFLTASGTATELRETGMFSAAELRLIERGNAETMMPKYKT
ncbi:amidohydrolase family protein [Rhodoplanes sp. Z2-YC6860]|uniref:amidohydrolase family protein n=1 Tax=Rhodoplanes sp. Z2-YC6860 TaxID=674703 RepID=UPI00078E3F73|nr:amidohydrolase family protein [Rhodoplanes sp. Z2-YC6860]AMN41224.1 TIM-barrel fold metal-dependent hydrolase [Rhodoplanes sp. Z2-YC6860]